jgi:hypothetical protein
MNQAEHNIYGQVLTYIKNRIQIPDSDLQESFRYITLREYKKGDYILKVGDYCRFIAFINSGLIVNMIIDEGKEIPILFLKIISSLTQKEY